jgi:uncharacterized membrane protein
MSERNIGILVLLTFLGMVGLYVGLYLAWQKYQEYEPTLTKLSDEASSLSTGASGILSALTGK